MATIVERPNPAFTCNLSGGEESPFVFKLYADEQLIATGGCPATVPLEEISQRLVRWSQEEVTKHLEELDGIT